MVILALDGGGTGCRARLLDASGTRLAEATGGPANIASNPEGARDSIIAVARSLLEMSGKPPGDVSRIHALLGVAGSNIHGAVPRLLPELPFARTIVENDARIALEGAIGPAEGVVASIGTGSVLSMRCENAIHSLGGWGYVLGDQASGAWLGRSLLSETLLAFDGMTPPSPITDQVLQEFGGDPARIVDFATQAPPSEMARFARWVVDADHRHDPVAVHLIRNGTQDLMRLLDAAAARFGAAGAPRICLLGGLGPVYAGRLPDRFRSVVHDPLGSALDGAEALARAAFATDPAPNTA